MAEVKYVVFSLGEQRYGINLDKVNGIEEDYVISASHYESNDIKGIIHLRNMIIPVFDLKRKFGLVGRDNTKARGIILTEIHGYNLAIEVDRVVGIYEVDSQRDINPIPKVVCNSDNKCLVEVMNINDAVKNNDVVVNISVDKLLTNNQMQELSEALEKKN